LEIEEEAGEEHGVVLNSASRRQNKDLQKKMMCIHT
jgi:hypothetical protein